MRWFLLTAIPALLAQSPDAHRQAFVRDVAPFLAKRCTACHNAKVKNADLDLARLREPGAALAERSAWEDVVDKIRAGEMPPPGMPRPTEAEVLALSRWVEEQTARAEAATPPEPGRVTARRLNRAEYNNTIRDLLGISYQASEDFPADDAGYGFDNIGDVLSLSPVLMEKYLSAAETISRLAVFAGAPPRATLARYPSDKTPVARHLFPGWGEYEIQLRFIDRRKEGEPLRVAMELDGVELDTGEFPVGATGPPRLLKKRLAVAPGHHVVRGVFRNLPPGEYLVDFVEIRGPYPSDSIGLPESHRRLFVCSDPTPACARRIVATLLPRAWRRPVSPAETVRVASFAEKALASGSSLEQAVRYSLQAMLVSPHFLFRTEPPAPDGRMRRLSNPELATRLSYFLWSSMPDDALAAANLQDSSVLRAEVRRMLADPKAAAFVENFAGQWLQLRNLEVHQPDPALFPRYTRTLAEAMGSETTHFFAHILRENRSILEFLDADYTFLNEELARHYGLEGVSGRDFRQVPLTTRDRGGVLTQASVLTVSSYPTRTSPVLRGKWVLENLLGAPPPPPPPGVPELDEAAIGNKGTLRQQLEQHRANPSCAVCHNKMDALGFGLENFDPVGQWRDKDGKFPIEAGGSLPGNRSFKTPGELRAILKADPKPFTRCLTEKLLTYALGRGLEAYDRPTISKICNKLAAGDYRMQELILEIVESLPFQYRK